MMGQCEYAWIEILSSNDVISRSWVFLDVQYPSACLRVLCTLLLMNDVIAQTWESKPGLTVVGWLCMLMHRVVPEADEDIADPCLCS